MATLQRSITGIRPGSSHEKPATFRRPRWAAALHHWVAHRGHGGVLDLILALALVVAAAVPAVAVEAPESPGQAVASSASALPNFDLVILGDRPVERPVIGVAPELVSRPENGGAEFVVRGQQVGIRIEEPAFVTAETSVSWRWRKQEGKVCIVQFELINPATNERRYLGYAAGALAEPPSADPTVEIFVADVPPRQGASVERALQRDLRTVLGWDQARLASVYLSPWDGAPGVFADLVIRRLQPGSGGAGPIDFQRLARIGTGRYAPSALPALSGKTTERFGTSFEECAPGRNSNANEWSAFGAIGDRDFNGLGRDLYVRYPLYDLAFRLVEAGAEIAPDSLGSFRLGLVNDRYPAIWGAWEHAGLHYRVSVMTVPEGAPGRFDLYKIEVQNPTDEPLTNALAAILEGPPDMRLSDGVVRGLGDTALLLTDDLCDAGLVFREWGLCDKRAKAYAAGAGPGSTEPAVATYRAGLDGVPVVYRAKVQPGMKYLVYLVTTPHIAGYWLEKPSQAGDLVYQYTVEGAAQQTLDYVEFLRTARQPLVARSDGAEDCDGDGYLEVRSGVAADSRIRHTRLSVIYVFPDGTRIDDPARVYSGALNDRCVHHIDVGATPEQASQNQHYDKTDVGFGRLHLADSAAVAPRTTRTHWLKIPPIHRREPVSMGYVAHAFREVLPGEAAPPFGPERVAELKAVDPAAAERRVADYWDGFLAQAARFDLPDPVLNDLYLSRLATRAILEVAITPEIVYDACSPFFYFDHAYRDQAYVVYAYDLAGLHDRAARVLNAYCLDVAQVPKGPIAFDGQPLQLGMLENGLWLTRPGQFDTQGQNLWALVEHYKLSGDRDWLAQTAYPFIKRGAMWIVDSRRRHRQEIANPDDPRSGLIEPGGMEVIEVGQGMHMYYMNAFAILGLREAADAARALDRSEEANLFASEAAGLKADLRASFAKTFKRTALYQGHLWFGVEPEGVGMYGFWAHCGLLWPCRALDPHDPLLDATWSEIERMSRDWGGGLFSESQGAYWPYIGVDWAISHLLRDEPDRTLDYFCAYVDKAGGTFSWGEGYAGVMAAGDQPHMWADAQYVNLFRHLFLREDESTLHLTPALFRRWHQGQVPTVVRGLPTHFGRVDLTVQPTTDGRQLTYQIAVLPRGDQARRELARIQLHARTPGGRPIAKAYVDGIPTASFTDQTVIIPLPPRGRPLEVRLELRGPD